MRIVFIGAGKIGVPTLQALLKSEHHVAAVVTQPDKPVGRTHLVEPPPIKKALMSGALYASPARTGRALPILLPRAVDILPNDTGGSLHDRLAQIAPEILLQSLVLLAKGIAPRIPQDNSLTAYAPKLKREDGRIDWSEPAEMIERKIRAFNPWPGALMKVDEQNLKIFSASVVDLNGKPGEILIRKDQLIVATGKDALALNEVQLEGKKRMSASEFLRGHRALSS